MLLVSEILKTWAQLRALIWYSDRAGDVTTLNTNTPGGRRVAVETGSKSFIIRRRATCHKSGKEYRQEMANTWYSPIARKGAGLIWKAGGRRDSSCRVSH